MLGRIGSLLASWKMGRLVWRLLMDGRVPLLSKLVVPAALLYTLFPIDLVPDFFPALGQLDDLTVLLLSALLFLRLCPRELVREHWGTLAGHPRPPQGPPRPSGEVVDGKYEILD